MSFRDRVLAKGKFRGVEFFYETSEVALGRRTALTEFPGQDMPFSEDLGRSARKFTLEMFVLGDDYDTQRRKLTDALEQPGPGTLVHPFWGPITVTVQGDIRVRESTKDRGIARISAMFVQTSAGFDVRQVGSTATGVVSAAAQAESGLISTFAAAFTVLDTIAAVAQTAVNTINSATSTLNSVRGKIAAALQVIDDAATAITQFSEAVESLVRIPQDLAADMTGLYTTVIGAVSTVTDAVRAAADFFGTDDATPSVGNVLQSATRVDLLARVAAELGAFGDDLAELPENTAQQRIEAENQRQLVRLVKTSVAINAARVAADLEFESTDQAAAVRDTVVDVLDVVLADDLPDELYSPLADLRAAIVEHLSEAADTLPQLDRLVPVANVPALVLAYQLYADHARDAEILARNPQIRNPTALPAGEEVLVLP